LDSGTIISVMVIFFALQVGDCLFVFWDGFWMIFFFSLVPERWIRSEVVG
jgi:hypothetical protein